MAIPQKMKALLQTGDGYSGNATGPMIDDAADWLELREVDVPAAKDGQALIRVRRASVNPSDTHFIKGEYGQPRAKGRPAGFEGCGEVIATGKGAEGLMGQRVSFVAGPSGSGAWAEYAVADMINCIPLRPDVNDNDASGQIVNPLTAMAMVSMAEQAGDSVIITAAASQLGKLMVGLAADKGMKPIATVRREGPVEHLKEIGAAEVLVTSRDDFAATAQATLSVLKPRMMLDAVSDQQSEQMFTMMPNNSRWVSYGKLATETPNLTQMGQLIFMGKKIEGFWLTQWLGSAPSADVGAAVAETQARFADGRWHTDVTAELSLDAAIAEMAGALAQPDGKVILKIWDGMGA